MPLPTRTQQLPTLLAEECWELLRPFARSLTSNVRFEFVGFTRGVECIINTAVINIGARGTVSPVAPKRTGSGRICMHARGKFPNLGLTQVLRVQYLKLHVHCTLNYVLLIKKMLCLFSA